MAGLVALASFVAAEAFVAYNLPDVRHTETVMDARPMNLVDPRGMTGYTIMVEDVNGKYVNPRFYLRLDVLTGYFKGRGTCITIDAKKHVEYKAGKYNKIWLEGDTIVTIVARESILQEMVDNAIAGAFKNLGDPTETIAAKVLQFGDDQYRRNLERLGASGGLRLYAAHVGKGVLRVRIYTYYGDIRLKSTMAAGDGNFEVLNSQYALMSLPEGKSGGTVHAVDVHVTGGAWVRVVLDHDGNGSGLAGVVMAERVGGESIIPYAHSAMHNGIPVLGVKDSSTVQLWFFIE